MFTQCPDCGTVFRVTATVLRAARGQVRCGVCDATFDALQYLTEEVDAEGGEDGSAPRGRGPGGAAVAGTAGAGGAAGARTGDTAEHERLSGDGRPVDAAAVEDDEFDEDFDDEHDEHDELSDAETEERILEAAAQHDRPATYAREDDGFPLEELDDPIDVLAQPGSGPEPEFPPYAPEPAAGRTPEPAAPAFYARAGRTTPSADEDRALAEIAAALARRAQLPTEPASSVPPAPVAAAAPPEEEFVDLDAVSSIDVDLLDTSAAENIVLEGGDEIPDAALEFDLPAEEWDRVFVPDADAPTIPPLDPALARAREDALREPPPRAPAAAGPGAPPPADEEFELELASDDAVADAVAAERRPPADDPLARTDEFPPLKVTPAEEAAAGLAGTPAARPRPGVPTEDFDALVAAAAARAAAEVAARTGAPATAGTATRVATATSAARAAPAAAAAAVAALAPTARDARAPAPTVPPPRDPPAAPEGAEATWFDARRDLAPEGAPLEPAEPAEPGELIRFDAQRFQAIARGRDARPWWATTLFALGLVVLALVLLAQAVHYWRDALAQHPVVGPPLQDAYARLGLPLEPEWNLGAYDVKQWGATSDVAPGTLRVRASVVNRAPRAQPHPLLRVTLLDRFSGKVARREFQPVEYLPGRAAPTGLLAPGARVDADLVIADPGSDAVGFELDVCLLRRGVLTCAGEQRLAAP